MEDPLFNVTDTCAWLGVESSTAEHDAVARIGRERVIFLDTVQQNRVIHGA
jgi:hypothetical protein